LHTIYNLTLDPARSKLKTRNAAPVTGDKVVILTLDNTTSGRIAERLRLDVLSGRLASGARLSEVSLAKKFGVSRTPIRQALAQLSLEGLLEAKPNAGVRVAPLVDDEIRDLILPIRQTLESYALRCIFPELNKGDFQLWADILRQMKKACQQRNYTGTAEQDIVFHRSLIQRTGQADLMAIWSSIVARLRSYFWESHRQYDDLMDVYREHRMIVSLFRRGNVEQAVKALTESMT
jgi:DNA-binding GntR family transcriptional regulator